MIIVGKKQPLWVSGAGRTSCLAKAVITPVILSFSELFAMPII